MTQVAKQPAPKNGSERVILSAHGLSKAFRMGDETITILKGLDLSVRHGEFLAIEGRSGSGKSTLLHILGALDQADVGTLRFDGQPYTGCRPGGRGWGSWMADPVAWICVIACAALLGWLVHLTGSLVLVRSMFDAVSRVQSLFLRGVAGISAGLLLLTSLVPLFLTGYISGILHGTPEERHSCRLRNAQFGFVFQFYHLLPELSVLENTMMAPMIAQSCFGFMGKRAAHRARAKAVLEQLGLSHRLHHRPSQLSGGERQRVAIARALINSPRILFADEPTGNLDVETGRQIMNVLEGLHRQKKQTIIMVTHDRSLARQADRVLVLKEGRLERPAVPKLPEE